MLKRRLGMIFRDKNVKEVHVIKIFFGIANEKERKIDRRDSFKQI